MERLHYLRQKPMIFEGPPPVYPSDLRAAKEEHERKPVPRNAITPRVRESVVFSLRKGGMTRASIAWRLGITIEAVQRIRDEDAPDLEFYQPPRKSIVINPAKQSDAPPQKKGVSRKVITVEMAARVIELNQGGMSRNAIAETMSLSWATVEKIFRLYAIELGAAAAASAKPVQWSAVDAAMTAHGVVMQSHAIASLSTCRAEAAVTQSPGTAPVPQLVDNKRRVLFKHADKTPAIIAALKASIHKTEIAQALGVSLRHVYDVYHREMQAEGLPGLVHGGVNGRKHKPHKRRQSRI